VKSTKTNEARVVDAQREPHPKTFGISKLFTQSISTGDKRYVDALDCAAGKSWHHHLAPIGQNTGHCPKVIDLERVPTLSHYRRPMMMNQQPFVSDALEEIRG
jgi:hypothetical protein